MRVHQVLYKSYIKPTIVSSLTAKLGIAMLLTFSTVNISAAQGSSPAVIAKDSVYRLWTGIPISNTALLEMESKGYDFSEVREKLKKDNIYHSDDSSFILFKNGTKNYLMVGHGSAYAITDDGFLVTNEHVVQVPEEELYALKILLGDMSSNDVHPETFLLNSLKTDTSDFKVQPAEIVALDSNLDLAIVSIKGLYTTPLTLASEEHIQQADPVYAIGFPGGSDKFSGALKDPKSYTDAVISSGMLNRKFQKDGNEYWEHDAKISPGNSGGPLINHCGEVVGTNVSLGIDDLNIARFGAIALDELTPLLARHDIAAKQAEQACDPVAAKAAASTNKKEVNKESNTTTAEKTGESNSPALATDTQKSENTSKIMGLSPTAFYTALGIGLLAILTMFGLLSRKRTPNNTSNSTQNTPPTPSSNNQASKSATVSSAVHTEVGGLPKTELATQAVPVATATKSRTATLTSSQGATNITLQENTPFVIGRSVNSDLVISDSKVSSRHLQLLFDGNNIFATDLQSTNGTFVNGVRLNGKQRIQQGDEINLAADHIAGWYYGSISEQANNAVGQLIAEGMSQPPITLICGRTLSIGRNTDNDIVITQSVVSGTHCIINISNKGVVTVMDSNSTNGTYLNNLNQRITKSIIKHHDVILLGNVSNGLRFKKF